MTATDTRNDAERLLGITGVTVDRPAHCKRDSVKPFCHSCDCEWCDAVDAAWEEQNECPVVSSLTISQAAAMLDRAGYTLVGGLPFDLEAGVAGYQVRSPDGELMDVTSADILRIVTEGKSPCLLNS